MRQLLAGLLGLLMVAGAAWAQSGPTAYDALFVSANVGDPAWATFVFGHEVNGESGVTELIVQCDQHRAELVTNFDVFGQQLVSQFFTVGCVESPVTFPGGKRTQTFTVNAVPLYESLVMTGRDANGNLVTQNLTLVVNGATWTVKGGGRWQTDSGSAEIAY